MTLALLSNGTLAASGTNQWGQEDVHELEGIIAISTGGYHVLALEPDGNVEAVGANNFGQSNVYNWHDIVYISAGAAHTVVLQKKP